MTENTPQAAVSRRDDAPAVGNLRGKSYDLEAWLEHGLALCNAGRFSEGESAFRRALEIEPGRFETLHLLGMVCSQQGRHAEALRHVDAALEIDPGIAAVHSSRGNVLAALKRFEEALQSFDRAVALDPDSPMIFANRGNAQLEAGRAEEALASYDRAIALDAADPEPHYGRGNTLQTLGRSEEALASYDRAIAIRPDYPEAFNNRGVALQELKRFDEALASYQKALTLRPAFPEAFNNRGNAFRELFLLEEALKSYDRALALKATFPEAWNNRGKVLQQLDRFQEALASYDKALALRPDYPDALTCRGNVLQSLNRFAEALASHDRAIALEPDLAEAFGNRGNALRKLKRFDEALASYEKAIALKPHSPEVFNNRGGVLADLKRMDEALASYNQAIAIYDPMITLELEYASAHSNRALLHLLLGNYKDGWQDNEWRWKTRGFQARRPNVDAPAWQGEDLSGRRLLVFTEQGLGDIIQFARYLPLLAERGGEIALLVRSRLVQLLQPLTVGIRVLTEVPESETFDLQCALMDLPLRFRTDLSSIPADVPYLHAEDGLVSRWKQRIGQRGFKVGIAWQGNPQSAVEEGRSTPLAQFAPLSRLPGVRLISLQKNHGLDQLARLPRDVTIETLGDEFDNGADAFIDTAAIMQNLDLIITPDTSIAHLAGALARPTWVALKYVPDWRWLLDRDDSPWYPTLRLFRQAERDRWAPVFARMEAELRTLSAP